MAGLDSMNPILPWLFGGMIVAFSGWQWKLVRNTKNTPMQQYSVEQAESDIEIRRYAPYLKASVWGSGSYQEISYRSFQRLAGYIFGGNVNREQIAMTSPVAMKYTDQSESKAEFSFVMPHSDVPPPLDSSVVMHQVPSFRAASIRFGGMAGPETFRNKEAQLKNWLDANGLTYIPEAEWLRYNPPFQLVQRRNEVLIRLLD